MRNLYLVTDGEAVLIGNEQEAVKAGTRDENNWGTDWIIVRARNASEALTLATSYDSKLNSGAITKPAYLRAMGSWRCGV